MKYPPSGGSIFGRVLGLYVLAVSSVLPGCDNFLAIGGDAWEDPFYYYMGEPIRLSVDASRLTVSLEVPEDTAGLRGVLTRSGVAPDSIVPLGYDQHWVAFLPAGTPAKQAETAARALRLSRQVVFASAAYRTPDGSCLLQLVNSLAVQFRADATPAEIAALNRTTGVSDERHAYAAVRTYRYPAQLAQTPLAVAAYYNRQPIVEWADADRIGCFGPLN
jgi:hypothetical protein